MDWKSTLFGFTCGLLTGVIVCTANPQLSQQNQTQDTKVEVVVAQTNDVQNIELSNENDTNSTSRIDKQKWFKENNKYIWDGWKIK